MTSTTPGLVVAGPRDLDTVADVVTAAFEPLKVIQDLVPDPVERRDVTRGWYRLHIEHAIRRGCGEVVMTEDRNAVAVWFDRTGKITDPHDYDSRLTDIAGDHLPRFEHLDKVMDANHPREPHWYLLFLATRPGWQSQGLGSTLMNYTHARLDALRIPAYLEATGIENRDLYRRNGYMDMSPPTIAVSDGTELYRMWRDPQVV